jgi:S1-C subfamily serine protease
MRAALLVLFLGAVVYAHPVATQDPQAKSWHLGGEEAVYIGEEKATPAIPLRKSAFTAGPQNIVIESDAQQIVIESGHTRFEIKTHPGVNKICLNGDPNTPSVMVEGRSVESIRGKWISIALSPGDLFTLQLPGATFATLKFDPSLAPAVQPDQKQSASAGILSPVAMSSTPPSAGTPISAIGIIEREKAAVFQIAVKDEAGQIFAWGSGFIVGTNGYAFTNFHVVQGASSAVALFQGSKVEIPIQLVDVHPELDLALIKVQTLPPGVPSLELQDTITAGEDVYALGYPLGLGFTVNKGSVNGLRVFADLPARQRRIMSGYDAKSQWVQTDCTINHGNSGGPLINTRGKVIGINTWCYADANNTFFALSAAHATALLKSPSAGFISFSQLRDRYKSVETPFGLFPTTLPSAGRQTGSAVQLSSASLALSNAIIHTCPRCYGRGEIVTKVKVGETGGLLPQPVFNEHRETCRTCDGHGRVRGTPEQIDISLKNLTTTLANCSPSNPKIQEGLPKAYAVLANNICDDQYARSAVVAESRAMLAMFANTKPPSKAPAYLLGYVIKTGQMRQSDERIHIIMAAEGHRLVMIARPILSDNIFPGDAVFAGGTSASTYESLDGQNILILQGGFLIKDSATASLPD